MSLLLFFVGRSTYRIEPHHSRGGSQALRQHMGCPLRGLKLLTLRDEPRLLLNVTSSFLESKDLFPYLLWVWCWRFQSFLLALRLSWDSFLFDELVPIQGGSYWEWMDAPESKNLYSPARVGFFSFSYWDFYLRPGFMPRWVLKSHSSWDLAFL